MGRPTPWDDTPKKSCCTNPGCTAPYHKMGTSHMYHKKKCRCDSCREAAAFVRNRTAGARKTTDARKSLDLRFSPIPSLPGDWQDKAACKGIDIDTFFPYDETSTGTHAVKNSQSVARETAMSYCNRCEVREECLQVALKNFERGIWGGTDTRERSAIRRAIQRNDQQLPPETLAHRANLTKKAKGTPQEKLYELVNLMANFADAAEIGA